MKIFAPDILSLHDYLEKKGIKIWTFMPCLCMSKAMNNLGRTVVVLNLWTVLSVFQVTAFT
jgi:hypothetical protein